MKKTNIKITRYDHGQHFVDIIQDGGICEAWIVKKDCGVSRMMFGAEAQPDDFLKIVEANLDEYVKEED